MLPIGSHHVRPDGTLGSRLIDAPSAGADHRGHEQCRLVIESLKRHPAKLTRARLSASLSLIGSSIEYSHRGSALNIVIGVSVLGFSQGSVHGLSWGLGFIMSNSIQGQSLLWFINVYSL